MAQRFVVLGIHEADKVPGVTGSDVGRVRMFRDAEKPQEFVDEDFQLVEVPGASMTLELATFVLRKDVEARMKELFAA